MYFNAALHWAQLLVWHVGSMELHLMLVDHAMYTVGGFLLGYLATAGSMSCLTELLYLSCKGVAVSDSILLSYIATVRQQYCGVSAGHVELYMEHTQPDDAHHLTSRWVKI